MFENHEKLGTWLHGLRYRGVGPPQEEFGSSCGAAEARPLAPSRGQPGLQREALSLCPFPRSIWRCYGSDRLCVLVPLSG